MLRPLLLCTAFTLPSLGALADAPGSILSQTFQGLDAQPVALSQYSEQVLLVNFWATWCPPCVREMPALSRLQQQFTGAPFKVLAIGVGENPEKVALFQQQYDAPLSLELLLDPDGRSFADFNLIGLPVSYLYNRQGEQVQVITGEQAWDSEAWQAQIRALLQP